MHLPNLRYRATTDPAPSGLLNLAETTPPRQLRIGLKSLFNLTYSEAIFFNKKVAPDGRGMAIIGNEHDNKASCAPIRGIMSRHVDLANRIYQMMEHARETHGPSQTPEVRTDGFDVDYAEGISHVQAHNRKVQETPKGLDGLYQHDLYCDWARKSKTVVEARGSSHSYSQPDDRPFDMPFDIPPPSFLYYPVGQKEAQALLLRQWEVNERLLMAKNAMQGSIRCLELPPQKRPQRQVTANHFDPSAATNPSFQYQRPAIAHSPTINALLGGKAEGGETSWNPAYKQKAAKGRKAREFALDVFRIAGDIVFGRGGPLFATA